MDKRFVEFEEIRFLSNLRCFDCEDTRKPINDYVKAYKPELVERLQDAWRNKMIAISINGGYHMTRKYWKLFLHLRELEEKRE